MPIKKGTRGAALPPYWKRLSDEKRQAVIDMYRTQKVGMTTVARAFGIGTTSVSRILQEAGIARDRRHLRTGMGPRRFTATVCQEIGAKYVAGASLKSLAVEYGCSPPTLANALSVAGVALRKRGNQFRSFTPKQVAKMKRLWERGMSQTAIGELYGATQSAVSNVLRHHGITVDRRQAKGERHGHWKGGIAVHSQGYVYERVPADSPFACMRNSGGYVQQHRLVMAQSLGRPLRPNESVHHVDGLKSNNRIENLELRQGQHGAHVAYCCADCGSRNVVPVTLN